MRLTTRPRYGSFLAAGAVQAATAVLAMAAVVLVPERSAFAAASSAGAFDPGAGSPPSVSAAVGTWRNPEILAPTPGPDDEGHAHEGAVPPPPVVSTMATPLPPAGFVLPLAAWDAVTDRFGVPRGENLVHGGIDLALDSYPRSAILSACGGTVSVAANSPTYGNYVMVNCGGGWSTLYGHLSEILVEEGDAVAASDILGASGSTGFSTGEHLHFEIRYLGVTLEPENYLDFKIDPNAPRSSGPIFIPTRETATPTPTAEPTGPSTTPTPTATATPEPTETPDPTLVPDPEDYFSVVIQAGEDAALGNTIELSGADPESLASAVLLAVNQFEAGASSPPAIVNLLPSCAGCAPVGVLVQVNLFVGDGQSTPDAASATVDRAQCAGAEDCRGLAYVLQIDVPLESAQEVDSPRMREFLAALAVEMRSLGLEIDAGTLHREGIETRLGAILALFPEYTRLVTALAAVEPEGSFPAPAPAPAALPTDVPLAP